MNTFLHAPPLPLPLSLSLSLSFSCARAFLLCHSPPLARARVRGLFYAAASATRRGGEAAGRLIRVIVLAESPLASPVSSVSSSVRCSVCKGYDLGPSLTCAHRVTLARHTSRLIPPFCRQTADRSHIPGRGMNRLGRRAGKINQPGGSLLFLTRGKTHQVRASWPLSFRYFSCVQRSMWVAAD